MRFTRIAVQPDKMGGMPCIRGLRRPVATVAALAVCVMALGFGDVRATAHAEERRHVVTGKLVYDSGYPNTVNDVPVSGALVEVWESDEGEGWGYGGDDYLGQTFTRADGTFYLDLGIVHDEWWSKPEIYVKPLSTRGDHADVSAPTTYVWTPRHSMCRNAYDLNCDWTADFGTVKTDNGAFLAVRAADDFWYDLSTTLFGKNLPAERDECRAGMLDPTWYLEKCWPWPLGEFLKVQWEADVNEGYYNYWGRDVKLPRWVIEMGGEALKDMLYAEAANWLQHDRWNIPDNDLFRCAPFYDHKFFEPVAGASGRNCAWVEGWAAYFQGAIQDGTTAKPEDRLWSNPKKDPNRSSILRYYGPPFGEPTGTWANYQDVDLEHWAPPSGGSRNVAAGVSTPYNVAAALWDVYDGANEFHDRLHDCFNGLDDDGTCFTYDGTTLSSQPPTSDPKGPFPRPQERGNGIWELSERYNVQDITAFQSAWLEANKNEPEERICAFKDIMFYHQLRDDRCPPNLTTEVTGVPRSSPSNPLPGSFSVRVKTTNQGGMTYPDSGVTRFYLVDPVSLRIVSEFEQSVRDDRLAPGQEASTLVQLKIPYVPNSDYYLIRACTDADNEWDEVDEVDNCQYARNTDGGRVHYVQGQHIVVTTEDDELNEDGDCSLREAIRAANRNQSVDACAPGRSPLPDVRSAETIDLPAGSYRLNLGGSGEDQTLRGDLDITDDLTIMGAGASSTIIDGQGLDRVFHVDPAATGIFVQIFNVTIQGGYVPGGLGGGIYVSPTAYFTLAGSTVKENQANYGGGIRAAGITRLVEVALKDNVAFTDGGGLQNAGSAILQKCSISGNYASTWGGGIRNRGTADLENVTISGNEAAAGGGIFNSGTANLRNVTIADNAGQGIYNNASVQYVQLLNTIVASGMSSRACGGRVTSTGHNLDSDGSCGLNRLGDLPDTDPILGPLANNGASTETHALLGDSPAIDAGDNNACPATDQRGVPRPQGTACDIGAFEFDPEAVVWRRPPHLELVGLVQIFPCCQYSDRQVFGARLTDELGGTGIEGAEVQVVVGSQQAEPAPVTDASGSVAPEIVINQSAGTVSWTATFAGNDLYEPAVATGTYTIWAEDTVLAAHDASLQYSDSVVLSATLTDDDETPIAGKSVSFEVPGACSGAGTTDVSGTATYVCEGVSLPAGTYPILVTYDGDVDYYNGASGTATLTVPAGPVASIDSITDEYEEGPGGTTPVALRALDIVLVGSFIDTGTADTQPASIAWGDGAVSTQTDFDSFTDSVGGAPGTAVARHAYLLTGMMDITFAAPDDNTGQATATAQVDVIDAATAAKKTIADLRSLAQSGLPSQLARSAISGAAMTLEMAARSWGRQTPNGSLMGDTLVSTAVNGLTAAESLDATLDLSAYKEAMAEMAKSEAHFVIASAGGGAAMAGAEQMAKDGDALLAAGDYRGAVERYWRAISYSIQGSKLR